MIIKQYQEHTPWDLLYHKHGSDKTLQIMMIKQYQEYTCWDLLYHKTWQW